MKGSYIFSTVISALLCTILLLFVGKPCVGFQTISAAKFNQFSRVGGSSRKHNGKSMQWRNTSNKPKPRAPFMADASASVSDEKKGLFDKIKSAVPPEEERKKLIPLALMFFAILFNYTILRDTKDVLMVTAPKSGAEVIPFIKTYVNLPAAIGFTGIYASLTNKMEQRDVFYTCVWPFLAFFSLFAMVLYPNRAVLHPHAFCDMLSSFLPEGFSAPLAIIRNWSFAVFLCYG